MLLIAGACVDAGFAAELGAIGVKALVVDAPGVAVLVVGMPGDGKAAIGQGNNSGIVLLIVGVGVDLKFAALWCAIG